MSAVDENGRNQDGCNEENERKMTLEDNDVWVSSKDAQNNGGCRQLEDFFMANVNYTSEWSGNDRKLVGLAKEKYKN